MQTAVIYARYSSDNQREESIEGQIESCTQYALDNNIRILDSYIDRAKTGTNDNRDGLKQMLKDSARKHFDIVLVWKLDRFGRNREEMAINKSRLRKNGVTVKSVKENIPDGPEGVLIESLMEGLAEYYSLNLSRDIRRGMHTNATKGKSTGGNIAFGYRIGPDKGFEVVEELRPIVVEIFTLYDNGYSFADICGIMNSRGIKTSRGSKFNRSTLRPMLSNEKYIGVYNHMGTRIEDTVPPIIDKELFDRVQNRLENISMKYRKIRTKKDNDVCFILTGKVFCKECGSAYRGESGTSKSGNTYYYYVCGNSKQKKGCKAKRIGKDKLEEIIVKTTLEYVLTPDHIEKIANNIVNLCKTKSESPYLSKLICDRAAAEKKIENMLRAIEEGIFTPSTKQRLEALERDVNNFSVLISREQIKRPTITKDAVMWFLNNFTKLDYSDPENQVRLINSLINSVLIDGNQISIAYNYTNNDGKPAFAECSSKSCMVEVRGVEPLSESPFTGASPSAVIVYFLIPLFLQ